MYQEYKEPGLAHKVFRALFATWAPVLYPGIFILIGRVYPPAVALVYIFWIYLAFLFLILAFLKKPVQSFVVAVGFGVYSWFEPIGYDINIWTG